MNFDKHLIDDGLLSSLIIDSSIVSIEDYSFKRGGVNSITMNLQQLEAAVVTPIYKPESGCLNQTVVLAAAAATIAAAAACAPVILTPVCIAALLFYVAAYDSWLACRYQGQF